MYSDFLSYFEANKQKIQQYGKRDIVRQEWIDDVEKELGSPLPDSYKWWCKEFEYFLFNSHHVFSVTLPSERDLAAEIDILYTYNINLENGILNNDQLSIFEPEDELYYFDIVEGIDGNEYKVYLKDYYSDTKDVYADNFLEFLKMKISEL